MISLMNSLRFKIQQKLYKLLTNKLEHLLNQQNFIVDETYLRFQQKFEEAENFLDDIHIFEAHPRYKFFSCELEKLSEELEIIEAFALKSLHNKLLLQPSELLATTVQEIEMYMIFI